MTDGRLPRWQETRETLSELLAWLEEARQWAEAAAVEVPCAEEASQAAPTWDTPSSESVPAVTASTAAPATPTGPEAVTSPDLFTFLAALTALRQEVKLQTRAARHEREQAAQALEQLSGAMAQLDRLRQEEASRHQIEVQEASRATVETLVELHDALSRAARQAGNMVTSTIATLRNWGQRSEVWDGGQPDAPPRPGAAASMSHGPPEDDDTGPAPGPGGRTRLLGWLGRLGRRAPVVPEAVAASAPAADSHGFDLVAELRRMSHEAARLADRLEGLTAGYTLSVQRLERALAACGIEPIVCLGQPVDAERMEVVQTVPEPAQPSGMVIDEVRRGYVQHGRVYRFAQVVATRSTQQTDSASPAKAVEGTPN